MTRTQTTIARTAGVSLALLAGSAVAAGLAQTAEHAHPRTAIVIAGEAATNPVTIARARATTDDVRVAKTTSDQLGVTHMLAARGYDTVLTVGVDRRIAITPVEKKFPHTRFVAAEAEGPGQR